MAAKQIEETINEILGLEEDSPIAKAFLQDFSLTGETPRDSEIEYWLGQQGLDTIFMADKIDNLQRAIRLVKAYSQERLQLRESRNIASPDKVYQMVKPMFDGEKQEAVVVLAIDTKNNVISRWAKPLSELKQEDEISKEDVKAKGVVFKGSLASCIIHPREIFGFAIKHSGASIVLAHNHPSGDPSPSAEDIQATGKLIECGKLMEIPLIDHLVVGDDCFTSLRREGTPGGW